MARAGLGAKWTCVFANDSDPMKASVYRQNWGSEHFRLGDVNDVTTPDLPGTADLAWASFPCQDLSLAGNSAGLGTVEHQTRSGAFWAFWRLMQGLIDERREPAFIVLENVYGSLTANEGREFALIGRCLALGGYRFGSILIDAVHFLPQSRPRVFIIGVRGDLEIPTDLVSLSGQQPWHPSAMSKAIDRLAEPDHSRWVWFSPPLPSPSKMRLDQLIEKSPTELVWHSEAETSRLIAMMSPINRRRLDSMRATGKRHVGTVYKRTRIEAGVRRQRAELRDDGVAGCLRTPGGGSSRQTVLVVDAGQVRSRLLSAREAARLMGLPESYSLPERYNDAYHVAGDGVVVPVVQFLTDALIEPIIVHNGRSSLKAAA